MNKFEFLKNLDLEEFTLFFCNHVECCGCPFYEKQFCIEEFKKFLLSEKND